MIGRGELPRSASIVTLQTISCPCGSNQAVQTDPSLHEERVAEPDGVYQLMLLNHADFRKDLRLQSHNPLNEDMLVLKKEGIMPLYGRLNAYIFLPSAAITLRVYEFVSGLPRVSSQGVGYGYTSRVV
jgi:hypothetical protein